MTSLLEAVEVVKASPDHRVLTRFAPDPAQYIGWSGAIPEGCKTGLVVDVETEGLDVANDAIIELAVVPFTFDPDGVVYDAGKGLSFFNDPKRRLREEIVALTGITDEMVRGQSIDIAAVRDLVDASAIVIAHHADFDRKMCERPMPFFRDRAWGCSHHEVPWKDVFGCRLAKIGIVLEDACGQFFDGHRAQDDCHAVVNVLANARVDGRTALSYLLESARQTSYRVWAVGSPFQKKDQLKARGYFWEGVVRKCWFRDVREADLAEEMMWARDVAGANPMSEKFTAKTRYR